MKEYIYLIRATRPGFADAPLPEELEAMRVHFDYLKGVYERGNIILVGPCLDRAFGVCVFQVESEEEAREIMENDPSVQRGVMSAELHEFRVSLLKK
jgi:uncharacterized protein YciI